MYKNTFSCVSLSYDGGDNHHNFFGFWVFTKSVDEVGSRRFGTFNQFHLHMSSEKTVTIVTDWIKSYIGTMWIPGLHRSYLDTRVIYGLFGYQVYIETIWTPGLNRDYLDSRVTWGLFRYPGYIGTI